MGGTSIWMSRRGREFSTAGSPEWNDTRILDHQARCWVLKERLRRDFGPRVLAPSHVEARLDTCPYLENCTVDASIFAGRKTSDKSLRDRKVEQNCQSRSVVKLLRAHGGCLGTRSR